MFKISWRASQSSDRSGVWCEDRNTLCAMISLLEASSRVSQIKIEIAGHVIKDPYVELGIGYFSKFVSAFSYEDIL